MHYQYLYREVNFPKPCAACSAQPKYGEEYAHCCPDPQKRSSFLQENLNFCGKITKDSKLCFITGKVFFLNVLFQHAAFITSGLDPPGCLAHLTSPENSHMGFLAFVRLVGCAYTSRNIFLDLSLTHMKLHLNPLPFLLLIVTTKNGWN